MIRLGLFSLFLSIIATVMLVPASVRATATAPATCMEGYVWRQADATDHVCVTPAQRDQAASENAATGLKNADGTCVQGYVWRQANPDGPRLRDTGAAQPIRCRERRRGEPYGLRGGGQYGLGGDTTPCTTHLRPAAANGGCHGPCHFEEGPAQEHIGRRTRCIARQPIFKTIQSGTSGAWRGTYGGRQEGCWAVHARHHCDSTRALHPPLRSRRPHPITRSRSAAVVSARASRRSVSTVQVFRSPP